ncbi:MAG: hypothetical protein LBT93_01855 [Treponema sp.]|jgi:hypothetical protein|nr:hypothetical protein [Treponema sp.]
MKKDWKLAVLGLMIAVIVPVLPVAAQSSNPAKVEWIDDSLPNQEEPLPQSATSGAGNRNYVTDVDNYMDVHFVNFIEVDKWFAFTGLENGKAALGYARSLGTSSRGNLFLGTYYNGNILKMGTLNRSAPDPRDGAAEIEITAPVLLPDGTILSTQIYDSYTNPLIETDNRFDILLRFTNLGMAIKLGVVENLASAGKADNGNKPMDKFEASTQQGTLSVVKGEPEYSYLKGDIIPSFNWGWILPIGAYYLLPRAEASVNLYQDSEDAVYKNYTAAAGREWLPYELEQMAAMVGITLPPSVSSILINPKTTYEGHAGNAISPVFGIGLELMFPLDGITVKAAGLKYNTGFTNYSNDYDINGISGSVKGTAAWKATQETTQSNPTDKTISRETILSVTEKSAMRHTITPIYRWQTKLTDRVSVGYNANIAFDIRSSNSDTKTQRTNVVETNGATTTTVTTNVYYNAPTTTTDPFEKRDTRIEVNALSITPALNIGTSYEVIPCKFTFNAGLKLIPPGYVLTSTKVYTNNTTVTNGVKTSADDNGNNIANVVLPDGTDVSNQMSLVSETKITSAVWTSLDAELAAGFTLYFTPFFALDAALTGVEVGPSGNKIPDLSNMKICFTLKK